MDTLTERQRTITLAKYPPEKTPIYQQSNVSLSECSYFSYLLSLTLGILCTVRCLGIQTAEIISVAPM